MTRNIKPVFYFLLLLLPAVAQGQTRVRVNEEIAEKFRKFCNTIPWEEVYLHTDRDEYIAGEPLWFSSFLFDRSTSTLSGSANTLYVELINPVNYPVVQKRVRLENGTGQGAFILPDTISSGTYLLRAYTSWMKNFLPSNCFMKEIRIFNSLSSRSFPLKAAIGTPAAGNAETSQQGQSSGFMVTIKQTSRDTVDIVLHTSENFRLTGGSTFFLFIQTHGIINVNESVRISGSSTTISVPVNNLLPGINQVVLFNAVGEPVYEKYIYTPDFSSLPLKVSSPSVAGKREKVSVEIDPLKDGAERMSLAVSATANLNSGGIEDYMVFGSEFGTLPDDLRGMKLSELPAEAINNFLSGAKSNWIDWKMILSDQLPDINFIKEKEYYNLSGTLVNKNDMSPDSGKVVYLSRPGRDAYLQYAKTDAKGRFRFLLPASLSGADIIIQPDNPSNSDIIKLESAFSQRVFHQGAGTGNTSASALASYLDKWSVNYQVGKIYNTSSTGEPVKQVAGMKSALRFYGKPDNVLIMDNYIKLPVMQEVFFELVPGVSLKSHKSGWEMTIIDPVDLTPYTIPPLLMVDGVVVKDASMIAGIDPELVERIETIRERYMIGDLIIYGMVNVITRAANFTCVPLPDYAVRIPWKTADQVLTFTSPDYSVPGSKNNHIPDFRNTLYWNPVLKPGPDGKFRAEFWSSDFASPYVIDIEGINSGGKIFSVRKSISVK
jgi:hypothetical protein